MSWGFLLLALTVLVLIILATRFAHRQVRPMRPSSRRATVVRAIPAGGFGQVRVDAAGTPLLLAACSAGMGAIPAGAEVEIVDESRSVVVVRPLPDTA